MSHNNPIGGGSSNKRHQNMDDEALIGSTSPTRSTNLGRSMSLVRPERNNLNDPNNPHHFYAKVASEQQDHLKVHPSATGLDPTYISAPEPPRPDQKNSPFSDQGGIPLEDLSTSKDNSKGAGTTVFGLNDEYDAPRSTSHNKYTRLPTSANPMKPPRQTKAPQSGLSFWMAYCYVITFWAPGAILSLCGMPKKDRQRAWREKCGLISVIITCGVFVAYLTFGFTRTVCKSNVVRLESVNITSELLVINGKAYNLSTSSHPEAAGIELGTNVLVPPISAGGMDASFLFQNVNGNCKGLITPKNDSISIPHEDDDLAWYMPCRLFKVDGSSSPNFTESKYYDGWSCHTSELARSVYYKLISNGDVYYSWDDIKNSSRNLVVYSGSVLDLDLIDWIVSSELDYPEMFDALRDSQMRGYDISILLAKPNDRKVAKCLEEIIKIGVIDSDTIGCIASNIVLYVSLIFILSVVFAKFILACYFKWFIAPKQGADVISAKEMNRRDQERDNWAAENRFENKRASRLDFLRHNRLSMNQLESMKMLTDTDMTTMALQNAKAKQNTSNIKPHSRNASLTNLLGGPTSRNASMSNLGGLGYTELNGLDPNIIHPNVIEQPPADSAPFGYPLAHTILLVTCYSEDIEGLRVTLDSLAITEYPNSHKLILILCDGLIKGSGNDMTTPEIALSMMTDFSVKPEDVVPYSYVAVAQGTKRHNMAKVYSGFYKYDDATVEPKDQKRVPIVTLVKCGTPDEATSAKPGNRGKRDSQIILMSFLQRITFNERMTELEYDIMLNIWKVTGLLADMYEIVLMVDADTKVYHDSLTHMIACMVRDTDIMGLCGETKIANKKQSWVSAIQVFEYYISHHQAKAFESVFGGVTCLPGCFCMYRIKVPKKNDGYWVPILANPDIVERYSDNVIDTLHKKNLLLLGEDRYLSSLMLKTFPKRKQIFVPKAACVTVVPDKFKVLLSQRRRWINSTVHNLMELVLVKDLCGTFCFSMQFVIGIELIGTLVLPAAICFTIYVVVVAIVSKPTPVLSLCLLAVILGLPGVIIVVTASSWSYFIWMFIYLGALPIWNFVLPSYAYWKFDDFSWGETRTIAGVDKGHEDEGGEFDHTKIKMRRWRDFERERISSTGIEAPQNTWMQQNNSSYGNLLDVESRI